MMLPGSAMLKVWLRPAVGVNTADGREVSTACGSPLSAASRFRFWNGVNTYLKRTERKSGIPCPCVAAPFTCLYPQRHGVCIYCSQGALRCQKKRASGKPGELRKSRPTSLQI